ncbi:Major Facilitator Superfamily protein [Nonomuraea pusilla]|uniref:Major Facilitator Superfamily protein n=1 Tax=Nonomuraea pusilla TaxID=46177 RepID=A0A1H7IX01_9ACTN|nr:Major Facilitator Superfamily protein [Nonomuraea pusilla]
MTACRAEPPESPPPPPARQRAGEPGEAAAPGIRLSRGATLLFAVASGTAVANVYAAQPLLATLGQDFGLGEGAVGAVVTVTQAGYGLGLLLLVPLGDVLDRRRLVSAQSLLLAAALAVLGTAGAAPALFAAAAAVGFLAVVTQSLVAFAAALAGPERRGRVVGQVTSGVVVGILLARTVSGLLADVAGWRAVYLVSAAATLLLALALRRALPPRGGARPGRPSYPALLRSTVMLFVEEPLLRARGVLALLVFAAFSKRSAWRAPRARWPPPPPDGCTTAGTPAAPPASPCSCSRSPGCRWPSPGSRCGPSRPARSCSTWPSRRCTSPARA